MTTAHIYQQDQLAGVLEAGRWLLPFHVRAGVPGEPVSLTMPTSQQVWDFQRFPAPFEGLLPRGCNSTAAPDPQVGRHDFFGQLLAVGTTSSDRSASRLPNEVLDHQ